MSKFEQCMPDVSLARRTAFVAPNWHSKRHKAHKRCHEHKMPASQTGEKKIRFGHPKRWLECPFSFHFELHSVLTVVFFPFRIAPSANSPKLVPFTANGDDLFGDDRYGYGCQKRLRGRRLPQGWRCGAPAVSGPPLGLTSHQTWLGKPPNPSNSKRKKTNQSTPVDG